MRVERARGRAEPTYRLDFGVEDADVVRVEDVCGGSGALLRLDDLVEEGAVQRGCGHVGGVAAVAEQRRGEVRRGTLLDQTDWGVNEQRGEALENHGTAVIGGDTDVVGYDFAR